MLFAMCDTASFTCKKATLWKLLFLSASLETGDVYGKYNDATADLYKIKGQL